MTTSQMSEVLRHLRRTVLLRQEASLTDEQLLEDFIRRRDSAALGVLVQRHGAMVWGVCRRVLGNYHDAEDAFQATFLVLVRKAASIVPRKMVANWLHGVAHQTARKARATAAKRRERESQLTPLPEPAGAEQDLWDDLRCLLDQELSQLPEKYRLPIVLCDLEGKTRKEAAGQLAVPEGTVAGRLARARALLAKRLAGRGLVLSGGSLAALLSQQAASAGVPASLVGATIEAATLVAVGKAATAGVLSPGVAALTEGVLKAMLVTKLKMATVILLAAGLLGASVGASGLVGHSQAVERTSAEPKDEQPARIGRSLAPPEKPVPPEGADPQDLLQGAQARIQIAEQRLAQTVETNLRTVRESPPDAPEAALQLLRESIRQVQDDPDIGERVRTDLLGQLGTARQQLLREESKAVWTLDFRFKNPRLLTQKIPEMGSKTVTFWYWCYAVRNPTAEAHTFLPAFEIVTPEKVYHDEVWSGVTEAVRQVEDPARFRDLKNSVTIASEPIPPSAAAGDRKSTIGVAVWGYADADAEKARSCTIFVHGLSNAWSSDGDTVRRKVLKVSFKRVNNEMIPTGPAEWVYQSYPLKPAAEKKADPRTEVEGLIRQLAGRIARLDQERQAWQKERERLQAVIVEWKKLMEQSAPDRRKDREAVLKEMERQLRSGEVEDQTRQIEIQLLEKRRKALEEAGPEQKNIPAEPSGAEELHGTVQKVIQGRFLQLSVGADKGVRKGERLEIYRLQPKPMYVGAAEVIGVDTSSSVARLIRGRDPQPGDQVARSLGGNVPR
jgi:RNA polymerase sigma factor (sigma-70 family)